MMKKIISAILVLVIMATFFVGTSVVFAQEEALVGSWEFDEGYGSTTYDSSGNNLTGTLKGNAQWAYSYRNRGITGYTSSTIRDYVALGENALAPLLNGAAAITVTAWVNRVNTATGTQRLFTSIVDGGSAGIELYFSGATLVVAGRDKAGAAWTSNVYPYTYVKQWKHIAATYDYANKAVDLYIDGVLQTATTTGNWSTNFTQGAYTPGTPTSPDCLGGINSANVNFAGTMDEIKVYKIKLSQEQITALAGASALSASSLASGLAGRWAFNEKEGTNAYDTSGNGLHGTITGATLPAEGGIYFDGTAANKIALGNNAVGSMLAGATGMTLSFRMNKTGTGAGPYRIFWMYGYGTTSTMEVQVTNTVILVAARTVNAGGATAGAYKSNTYAYTATDAFHHITITMDYLGKAVKLYIDGTLQTALTNNIDAAAFTENSYIQGVATRSDYIGNNHTTSFTGVLDDIRIYRRVLTESEISQIALPAFTIGNIGFAVGENNAVTCTVPIVNQTAAGQKRFIVTACYENNMLISIAAQEAGVPFEGAATVENTVEKSANGKVKTFIWDSIGGMLPTSDVAYES